MKNSNLGEILVRSKCIVDSDYDEINEISFKDILLRTNRKELHLTIAPTNNCNFKCIYCFEQDRRNVIMDSNVIEDLISFIASYKDIDTIGIDWFGGEPLMSIDIIEEITNHILKLNKKINSFIVTNGYLLNKKNISTLKRLGINSAQITIDGPKEIHDKRRPLLNGNGTFDKIIKNIDNVFNEIPEFGMIIRVNIDKENSSFFKDIYSVFKERYFNRNINVYVGFVDGINACASINNCNFSRTEQVEFKKNILKKHSINLGVYPSNNRKGFIAKYLNGYVVRADGMLFKCWNYIGMPERSISNVNKPKTANCTLFFRYFNAENNIYDEQCKGCISLPICDGGCQYTKLAKKFENKDIDICHFAKDNLKDLLEMHYEYSLNNNRIS